MGRAVVAPKSRICGVVEMPGDKSISHRAVMLASIAEGPSTIRGYLNGDDCKATIDCFRALGVAIYENNDVITLRGRGLRGLCKPGRALYAANSGTLIRLISGILAAQSFDCEIGGDASVESRPMRRVIEPLRHMGANISGSGDGFLAPLSIKGGAKLRGIEYTLPMASAQVKSCVLLAGLYADRPTTIVEPTPCRDHTEVMLKYMGADIDVSCGRITIKPTKSLIARDFIIPGDISSAAFWIVAALIAHCGDILIKNVGINPTRIGIIDVLIQMGGEIEILNRRVVCGEPVADIHAKHSSLKAVDIGGAIIPRLIDEIPILAVAAMFSRGTTVISDAEELRGKEVDRIAVMACELGKMGANIKRTADGLIIEGPSTASGCVIDPRGDHRVAMSCAIAALAATGETVIENAECANVSYPHFFDILDSIAKTS